MPPCMDLKMAMAMARICTVLARALGPATASHFLCVCDLARAFLCCCAGWVGRTCLAPAHSTSRGSWFSVLVVPSRSVHHHSGSATAGYPVRSSKLPDFDGKIARMGMASGLITVVSPSGTAGHIASHGVPNATMRRLRNRPQNGAECCQPLWPICDISFILLVRVLHTMGC